jgi:hypothetical protein
MLIADDRRVDLTEVHRHHVVAGRRLGLLAVLDDEVPGVSPAQLVVDQPDLQEAHDVPEIRRDRDGDRGIPSAVGEDQDIPLPADPRGLPDRGAELPAMVGELRCDPGFAASP